MASITGILFHDRLLPILAQHADDGTAVNMLDLSLATGLDFVSAFSFGIASSTNFLHNESGRRRWLEQYNKSHGKHIAFWIQELPTLTKWLTRLGIPIIHSSTKAACQELEHWCLKMCDAAEQVLLSKLGSEEYQDGTFPVAYHQLKSSMARETKHRDLDTLLYDHPSYRLEIASVLLDHLGVYLLPRTRPR